MPRRTMSLAVLPVLVGLLTPMAAVGSDPPEPGESPEAAYLGAVRHALDEMVGPDPGETLRILERTQLRDPGGLASVLSNLLRGYEAHRRGGRPEEVIGYLRQAADRNESEAVPAHHLTTTVNHLRSLRAAHPAAGERPLRELICHLRRLAPETGQPSPTPSVDSRVIRPARRFAPAPIYPPSTLGSGSAGAVVVSSLVDAEGCVHPTRRLREVPGLTPAAFEALTWWVAEPGTVDGAPAALEAAWTLHFESPDFEDPAVRDHVAAIRHALGLMIEGRRTEGVGALQAMEAPPGGSVLPLLLDLLRSYEEHDRRGLGDQRRIQQAADRVSGGEVSTSQLRAVLRHLRSETAAQQPHPGDPDLHRLLCHLQLLSGDWTPLRAAPVYVLPDLEPESLESPVPVFKLRPNYTVTARDKQIQADVTIRALIDAQGCVRTVDMVEDAPHGLGEQTLANMFWWVRTPLKLHGEPRAVYNDQTVTFRLR